VQPSVPHCFPVHWGVQELVRHWPLNWSQVSPDGQIPQDPWHLSSPHSRAKHTGVQGLSTHCRAPVQIWPVGHVPQLPVQPSVPH
jgi:hypothetical protein